MSLRLPTFFGGERVADVSGGAASAWRHFPNPLTLAFESRRSGYGEMEESDLNRLIWNKAIGPLTVLYSVAKNRGFDGKRLTEEPDGFHEKYIGRKLSLIPISEPKRQEAISNDDFC